MRTFKTMFKLLLLHTLVKSSSSILGEITKKNPKTEKTHTFQKNWLGIEYLTLWEYCNIHMLKW